MKPLQTLMLPCAAMLATSVSHALTFDLPATQVGGFFEDMTADNDAVAFQNYYVGYSTSSKVAERRNFFYFDLTGVTDPILDAALTVTLPFGGFIPGTDPVVDDGIEEIFVMSGTPFTSAEVTDTGLTGPEIEAIFLTFGTGAEITDGTIFSTATPPPSSEIVIPLNTVGLDLLNANLGAEVILTGRIGDLSIIDPPTEGSELIFGLSDVVVGGAPADTPMPFLTLTTVPESSQFAMIFGVTVLGLVALRRRND